MKRRFQMNSKARFVSGVICAFLLTLNPLYAQSGVMLKWQAPTTVSGVSGPTASYNVKRGITAGSETTIGTTSAPTASYLDSKGVGNTVYYYIVTATNGGGESGVSNEIRLTFPVAPPPPPQI